MEDEEDNGEEVEVVEKKEKTLTAEEMHVYPITRSVILFQVLLMFAAFYYCMLLTNWGNPYVDGTTTSDLAG